jgi:hypothetical protein
VSIFGKIMSKIFTHPAAGTAATPSGPTSASGPSSSPAAVGGAVGPIGPTGPVSSAPPSPMSEVDVEKVLTDLAAKYDHPVNWRYSIVDLMSILGIDNSLSERKALAKELGYTGDMGDSAKMNIWLHKQVMQKLAENGGRVPADLTD